MIIIGSKALFVNNNSLIDVKRFENSDFDVIMSNKDFFDWTNKHKDSILELYPKRFGKFFAKVLIGDKKRMFEIEISDFNLSSSFLLNNTDEVCENLYVDPMGTTWNCLKTEYLFLTKKSHLYFPVHFEKSINDYHLIKKFLGDFIIDSKMSKYFELRLNEAKKRFQENHRTPKLNVTNEQFFKISGVSDGRVYVHDDLHEVVKHFNKPIYEMMKKEENFEMAWCEKDMFNNLPYDVRIKCVQEEAYVIALERYIIPKSNKHEDLLYCYKRALMRICTTLCSGFFREFAVENYPKIIEEYNDSFFSKFNFAVENNYLKPMP